MDERDSFLFKNRNSSNIGCDNFLQLRLRFVFTSSKTDHNYAHYAQAQFSV